jgi:hypothetical protein
VPGDEKSLVTTKSTKGTKKNAQEAKRENRRKTYTDRKEPEHSPAKRPEWPAA